jgi:hypothetical protein
VDKGDVISILAALIIVSSVAVLFNPLATQEYSGNSEPFPPETVVPPSVTESLPSPTPSAPSSPIRIFYQADLTRYPNYYLPDNLSFFGGSDLPWKTGTIVAFAYVKEARGGITQEFFVSYPVWRLNCTTVATTKPAAAHFRMALIDAETGAIVDGAELHFPGNIIKNVQVGNKEFYLIIGAENIDSFQITLETLPRYL